MENPAQDKLKTSSRFCEIIIILGPILISFKLDYHVGQKFEKAFIKTFSISGGSVEESVNPRNYMALFK